MNNNSNIHENQSNNHSDVSKNVKDTNIRAMATVSFLMNFTSGMIVSSANNFLSGELGSTQEFLGLVRGSAEGMGHAFKIIFGMLSDYFKNRKIFLMIGYGGMFILKPMFGLSALPDLSKSMRLFLYGFTHASDRLLNAMRDSVRDASIYESSEIKTVGKSLGLRKLMACLGSCLGGLFFYFASKKYVAIKGYLTPEFFSKMYFSTIIPVSLAIIVLKIFVKDLFQEKYKNVKIDIFKVNYVSSNILLGDMIKETMISWCMGSFVIMGGIELVNLLCKWNIRIISDLLILKKISQFLSIGMIGLLVLEIFLVKIYPNFFNKDKNNRQWFKNITLLVVGLLGMVTGQIFTILLNNQESFSGFTWALKNTFLKYGLNGTVIVPFIIIFKYIFYKLYLKMQNTLEFYQDQLKTYDKLIILNCILAFNKYSDIFLFQHIIKQCQWSTNNNALLFAILYFFFGIFSFILAKFNDSFFKKYSIGTLVSVNIIFNLVAGYLNCIPMELRGFFGIFSLLLYGIYVGFIDCVLVSIISKSIPANHLLATLLGLFYLLIGVGNTCASYFIGTIFENLTQGYRFAIIPSLLGFLYFLWNYKTFTESK